MSNRPGDRARIAFSKTWGFFEQNGSFRKILENDLRKAVSLLPMRSSYTDDPYEEGTETSHQSAAVAKMLPSYTDDPYEEGTETNLLFDGLFMIFLVTPTIPMRRELKL